MIPDSLAVAIVEQKEKIYGLLSLLASIFRLDEGDFGQFSYCEL
jgi:hypothetical protein